MPSERIQRRIDTFLDQAEAAADARDWPAVAETARAVMAMDPENEDASALLRAAEANLDVLTASTTPAPTTNVEPASTVPPTPESFATGRYQVRKFLGEGGRKRVFLARDSLLDRDVAFALIKTDGLDEVGRERIVREAQAMGRMGAHPHIVSIFDLGVEQGAPYIVTELMGGGDVEGELERNAGSLELTRSLEIATGVARGLAFAHERGIVHRDLKPGNVWLTDTGVPKIGDFGLAVAEGRSRLTQHGMMVGTFAYMPPEQALGNAATAQSDLYSLGAMLYELVTGHPPFQGDTATAVISQHLNTAPVAPSWHTQRCPPALEDLILALLAKEPSQRPASASDVVAILEAVDPAERSRSRSDSAANPLDRLASGVFVGRERELERLRAALDRALAGHGSLVMLVGEPGIGKTRTTQELETYARMRGAKVLWGRANEAAGAPPYWPWMQAARDYRAQTPEEDIRRRQYQPYAVELQRIFPALRDLFPNLPESTDADSEGGQFRLYDALTSFLISVATETPLVVVLDDLHWADAATLALLTHLTRELGRARILVLGTYRDTDLDRRHPLSQALAELNREDLFTRIPLRGLSLAESNAYIRRTADVNPAPSLVQRIHDETEGNPFFLAEVVNLMAEEGTLSAPLADVQIPEGVRQALGRRLDRLSEEANALLTTLAVVGREFDHVLVLALAPDDDVTTLRLVEEALRARVLEELGAAGRYRFRHALMQQTLLEELSAARRVLLHGEIAEALLATYGPEDRDHLPQLAEHYAESAVLNPAHARLAASTLRRAAESAAAALARTESARLYERCLALVTASPDHLGEDEGLLWLELALARLANVNTTPGWEAFDHAAALLESRPEELAPAAVRLALLVPGTAKGRSPLWRRLAGAIGTTQNLPAYQLLAVFASTDPGAEGDAAAERAGAIAELLGITDPRAAFLLTIRAARNALAQGDFATALSDFESARPLAKEIGGLAVLVQGLSFAVGFAGDLERLDQVIAELSKLFRAAGQDLGADGVEAQRARLRWRREGAADIAAEIDELLPSLTVAWLRMEMALEQGKVADASAALPPADHPTLGVTGFRAADLGLRCRVLLAGEDLLAAREAFVTWHDFFNTVDALDRLNALSGVDDALCVLADRNLLERIAAEYESWTQWRMGLIGGSPDCLRGAIALKLNRVDDAERWFRIGLEWAQRWGVDTFAGRSLYGLAEVAERRGNHAIAMQHLDGAGALFAKRGAKLYLDQVIAKKSVLGA
jgi:hypothetical protein